MYPVSFLSFRSRKQPLLDYIITPLHNSFVRVKQHSWLRFAVPLPKDISRWLQIFTTAASLRGNNFIMHAVRRSCSLMRDRQRKQIYSGNFFPQFARPPWGILWTIPTGVRNQGQFYITATYFRSKCSAESWLSASLASSGQKGWQKAGKKGGKIKSNLVNKTSYFLIRIPMDGSLYGTKIDVLVSEALEIFDYMVEQRFYGVFICEKFRFLGIIWDFWNFWETSVIVEPWSYIRLSY